MIERWMPVKGYKGYYEVSDLGNVRSLDRRIKMWNAKKNAHVMTFIKGQDRKLCPEYEANDRTKTPKRYAVTLCKNNIQTKILVHKLVMQAFKIPKPRNTEIAHRNGIGTDNRLTNLYYATHIQNCLDRVAHGTEQIGANNSQAKLSEQQVLAIRGLDGLVDRAKVAVMFGVSPRTIWSIQTRRTWAHLV